MGNGYSTTAPDAPGADVVKIGWLRADGWLCWRRRYVVLRTDGLLEFFGSDKEYASGEPPVEEIDLFGAAFLYARYPKVPRDLEAKPCLEINTSKRTRYVYSDDGPADMEAWALSLNDTAAERSSRPLRIPRHQHAHGASVDPAEEAAKAAASRAFLEQVRAEEAARKSGDRGSRASVDALLRPNRSPRP